jgi:GT2 family glycosyltransferase
MPASSGSIPPAGDAAPRPAVDVVVPFAGGEGAFKAVLERVRRLGLRPGDRVVVVDNRPGSDHGAKPLDEQRVVLGASEQRSSYYARNRGAELGEGDWLIFFDADVDPPQDLLDRYFTRSPAERTAVLAGSIVDRTADSRARPTVAERYQQLRHSMSQEQTVERGSWSYAQTANCAVRRTAFEEVGGFVEEIRSGGDADLCFRLRAAGWELEPRPEAEVGHHTRRDLLAFLRQRARHGSGAAWLERRHPGSSPRGHLMRLGAWALTSELGAVWRLARRDRDAALLAAVTPLSAWAFQLGRLVPNRPPGSS